MPPKRRTMLLKLAEHDEERELEFELDFQATLTVRERFRHMERFSNELRRLMEANGFRESPGIVKHS